MICPHCKHDLRDKPIPEEYLRKGYYGGGVWNEDRTEFTWDGKPQWFGREIMVEISGVYDGGLYFQCPDCAGRWHRWPEGHPLRKVAERYVNAPDYDHPFENDHAAPAKRTS